MRLAIRAFLLRGIPALALLSLGVSIGACGNTLQDQPIASSSLEKLIMVRSFPVYWLGTNFKGLAVASVTEDPSGAFMIQYGNCSIGGQYTCVSPIALVTNPDNSFLPGGSSPARTVRVRGVRGLITRRGDALEVPTGRVLVDVYAHTPALARAAVTGMTPINQVAVPGATLPAHLPNSGFAEEPLVAQVPPAANPLHATPPGRQP